MAEIKIARFVDIQACKSIFSEHSTFVLRSPIYYQRLYETSYGEDTKGDNKEGRPETANGTAEFTRWLVSCWTILKESEPSFEEWDIFKKNNQNVVAIISTPKKVCEFLEKSLKIGHNNRLPFYSVDCHEVEYDKKKVHIDHTNIIEAVPFVKDKRFIDENEYRFVLKYGIQTYIDSFIFCGGIDYMEKCLINPNNEKETMAKLLSIISNATAGYFDFCNNRKIIANYKILLEKL